MMVSVEGEGGWLYLFLRPQRKRLTYSQLHHLYPYHLPKAERTRVSTLEIVRRGPWLADLPASMKSFLLDQDELIVTHPGSGSPSCIHIHPWSDYFPFICA